MKDLSPEFFEEVKAGIIKSKIEYLTVAGIEPITVEERHVACRLPAGHMHLNHVGIMYAGSYFVLAESAGANLIKCTYGSRYVAIIKSVSIDYVKPTKGDLIADLSMTVEQAKERIAYVEEHGKGQYPLDVPVTDAEGALCANAHIVYYLMPRP